MKTLNIEIPSGHEIDLEQSNLLEGKIVFKEIKRALPKTWEELGRVEGYYVNSDSEAGSYNSPTKRSVMNVFPTKELAEASIAMAQLSQLREVYRDGWKPNWDDISQIKHVIELGKNKLIVNYCYLSSKFLSFQSPEIRDEFLKNFRELIETAKPLMS